VEENYATFAAGEFKFSKRKVRSPRIMKINSVFNL